MHREQLPVQTQQSPDKRCRRGCPLPVILLERRDKSEQSVKTYYIFAEKFSTYFINFLVLFDEIFQFLGFFEKNGVA